MMDTIGRFSGATVERRVPPSPPPRFEEAPAPLKADLIWKPHALCQLFPMMGGAEFELFKADIEKNGQRDPIVMLGEEVLDGQHRLRACRELGIQPIVTRYSGVDPAAYVMSKNLARRHLTPQQRAAIVASATDWNNAAGVGRPENNSAPVPNNVEDTAVAAEATQSNTDVVDENQSGNSATLSTIARRAAIADVSPRLQRKADALAKADPDLARQVAAGAMSLDVALAQVKANAEGTPASEPEKPKTPLDRAQARIVALEAEATDLRAELARIIDERDIAVETIRDLKTLVNGEDATRLEILRNELRGTKATADTLMAEKAQLVREVKRLNRKLGVRL